MLWIHTKTYFAHPDSEHAYSTTYHQIYQVNAFYNFWYGFKSWREFTHEDEQSVEEGMGRYERRQAENANAKLRQAKKKEETQRVRTLVERAEKTDPRIIAIKEAEKAEKQRRKDEKKNKAMAAQLEEQAKKKAEEDSKKAEEEAANAAKNVRAIFIAYYYLCYLCISTAKLHPETFLHELTCTNRRPNWTRKQRRVS